MPNTQDATPVNWFDRIDTLVELKPDFDRDAAEFEKCVGRVLPMASVDRAIKYVAPDEWMIKLHLIGPELTFTNQPKLARFYRGWGYNYHRKAAIDALVRAHKNAVALLRRKAIQMSIELPIQEYGRICRELMTDDSYGAWPDQAGRYKKRLSADERQSMIAGEEAFANFADRWEDARWTLPTPPLKVIPAPRADDAESTVLETPKLAADQRSREAQPGRPPNRGLSLAASGNNGDPATHRVLLPPMKRDADSPPAEPGAANDSDTAYQKPETFPKPDMLRKLKNDTGRFEPRKIRRKLIHKGKKPAKDRHGKLGKAGDRYVYHVGDYCKIYPEDKEKFAQQRELVGTPSGNSGN